VDDEVSHVREAIPLLVVVRRSAKVPIERTDAISFRGRPRHRLDCSIGVAGRVGACTAGRWPALPYVLEFVALHGLLPYEYMVGRTWWSRSGRHYVLVAL
jgi:hypothetical protein